MAFWSLFGRRKRRSTFRPPKGPPPTLRERFRALQNIPKMFRMIWETSRPMFVANLLLRVVQAAVPLVTLYIGKLIIDEVIALIQSSGETDTEYLIQLVLLELVIAIVSDILGRSIALLDSLLGDLFSNRTSVMLIEHAASLDLNHFEDATFYDKLERARRQTSGRMALMSQSLRQLQDSITLAFLAVGILAFNPWLILLLVLSLLPAFIGESHFNTRSYSLIRGWTPERRELDYLRFIGAADEPAKEVKIFGLAPFLGERYANLADKYYAANRDLAIQRAGWGTIFSSIGSAGYYVAYLIIALRTVSGDLTVGDLTFLAGSFSKMRGLLQGLLNRFSILADGALYLQDLFDFFAMEPQVVSPEKSRRVPRPIKTGFHFENVGFKYINSENWALRNVSFELAVGEKIALVGENGAGKTTLVKLLARLYDPGEGRILLDGHDLREYDLIELRREIGVIFQDFIRYHFTARENIAVGQIDARSDQSLIEESARRSLADKVIDDLPGKYKQVLGKRFEGGVNLSGGEWQKVALARAYMRSAQLLILDEPTAALDARAEHEVFQRFTELTEGKSAVLISHRFSTVRMATRILVLDNGHLIEMGSHQELLAQNGRYAELFNLQAAGYR